MGLVSGEPGRGTFVREMAVPPSYGIDQVATAADVVDLSFNYPALPGQAEMLRQALRQLASSGDVEALLRYQPHGGRPHERDTVARQLKQLGLPVDGGQVLIVSGAQHGLAATAMAMLRPGDVAAADTLTYPGFKVLAKALHLEIAPIPLVGNVSDLDAFEQLCATRRVRAVYAMPTMHNPLGSVTTADHREQFVDIARRYDLLIIEDAAYAFLVEQAPPPLASLAPERTVYVSGLAKNVATGLRFGFVAAPIALVPAIERVIRATTWNTPAVMTAIACRWLEDGTVAQMEEQKRDDAKARQAIARDVLAGLPHIGHPSSYFLWLPLIEEARADQIAAALMRERISVSTAEPFATSANVPHAIRLALGSADLDTLSAALGTVKRVVDEYTYR